MGGRVYQTCVISSYLAACVVTMSEIVGGIFFLHNHFFWYSQVNYFLGEVAYGLHGIDPFQLDEQTHA